MPNKPSPSSRRQLQVRPATWLILAGVFLSFCAIAGAFYGSQEQFGKIPTIRAATGSEHTTVAITSGRTLDNEELVNPVPILELQDTEALSLLLSPQLQNAQLTVTEVRTTRSGATGTREMLVDPHTEHVLLFPAYDKEKNRLQGVTISGLVPVRDSSGTDSVVSGMWSVRVIDPVR